MTETTNAAAPLAGRAPEGALRGGFSAVCAVALSAALYGFAAGLATCGWLPEMLIRYFGMPPVASWLASLGCFAAFAGLHFAAFAAWLAWLARRGTVSPFAVALGFVTCEWAQGERAFALPLLAA